MKSVNVFKNDPSNKITISMEECLVVSLKLCGLGLRLYFLLTVLMGSMECKTCCLL